MATPFDQSRLDRLMDEAGIDVIVATSKHNVQYLTGGHRAHFFDTMDATGITRYLPVLVYPKGQPEKAAYIGHRLEKFQVQVNPLWIADMQTTSAGSVDAMQKAIESIRKQGLRPKRIAAEFGFLPYDAANALRSALRARAPAREEIPGRIETSEIRLRRRDRVDGGGDCGE
jgi:Xaa-Pro aminopeptidase